MYAFIEKPQRFEPMMDVVSCICWFDEKVLCLRRNNDKREGGKWGFPAGKLIGNESIEEAIRREVLEELSIKISDITYRKQYYVKYPKIDYNFHVFDTTFKDLPLIQLKRDENQEYEWKRPKDFLASSVVNGNSEIFYDLYGVI